MTSGKKFKVHGNPKQSMTIHIVVVYKHTPCIPLYILLCGICCDINNRVGGSIANTHHLSLLSVICCDIHKAGGNLKWHMC